MIGGRTLSISEHIDDELELRRIVTGTGILSCSTSNAKNNSGRGACGALERVRDELRPEGLAQRMFCERSNKKTFG